MANANRCSVHAHDGRDEGNGRHVPEAALMLFSEMHEDLVPIVSLHLLGHVELIVDDLSGQ